MSPAGASPSPAALAGAGPPLVNQALAPAAVRDGHPGARQAYETALGFEEMLVSQLSQTLVETSGSGESETRSEAAGEAGGAMGGAGEAGTASQAGAAGAGALSSLLPQALTEGVMRDGGLGLAGQLMGALDPAGGRRATGVAPSGTGVSSAAGAKSGASVPPANVIASGGVGV